MGGGLGGTEGDESSPTEYQGGDYRKLTVGGGGKFYRDTTKFSAPITPQHQTMNNDRSPRGNYSVNASVTPQQTDMTSCNGE